MGAERFGSAVVDEESVGDAREEEGEGRADASADVADVEVVVEESDGVEVTELVEDRSEDMQDIVYIFLGKG